MLFCRVNVLKDVESIDSIIAARHGAREHVVNKGLEFPAGAHPFLYIFDEDWIEIGRRKLLNFLADNTCSKGIGASDLKDVFTAGQKLCGKFVPGQCESQPLRIVVPCVTCHKPE